MPASLPPDCDHVFHGIMFDIYQCPTKQYDGSTKTFEYLVRQDSVTVLGFLDPETLILTEQQQPGREAFFDFPGGRVDPGESHEQAAHREFEEETGYHIGRIMPLWNFQLQGSTRFEKTFFLATDLERIATEKHLDEGERVRVFPESLADIAARCHRRELRQIGGMLCILNILHDPETNERVMGWLKRT